MLRVLLISDLHAFVSPTGAANKPASHPSYLDMNNISHDTYTNPMVGLQKLIAEKSLKADIIICGGDMGDKACPAGIQYVWSSVQALKSGLGASLAIGTVGNHDVDSRYVYDEHDPFKTLKGLIPRFPGLDDIQCDSFWSNGFAIVEFQQVRIVILNSCARHGAGRVQEHEYERGFFDRLTLHLLRDALAKTPTASLNILLCHHHPIRFDAIPGDDYSEMLGGDLLVHELGITGVRPWIIFHGHRHYPRIIYGQGGSSSPVIFSAGSLSARLYPELASRARNQVYLVEFQTEVCQRENLDLAASAQSWDWIPHLGWQKAGPQSGLPAAFGFGRRVCIAADSKLIYDVLYRGKGRYFTRSELFEELPWIPYVLPSDLCNLLETLIQRGVRVGYDTDGQLEQLGVL
jgi:hypothetical protein